MSALTELAAYLTQIGKKYLLTRPIPEKAASAALSEIKQGISPQFSLTKAMGHSTDQSALAARAKEQGFKGVPEQYHGSKYDLSQINPLEKETGFHVGTKPQARDANKAATRALDNILDGSSDEIYEGQFEDIMGPRLSDDFHADPDAWERGDLDMSSYGSTYPLNIQSKNVIQGEDPGVHDYISEFLPDLNRDEVEKAIQTRDAVKYTNTMEGYGGDSYIPLEPPRSRHAMYNPEWKKLKDILAGTGLLGVFLDGEDDEPQY